jgi:hypothetical protein
MSPGTFFLFFLRPKTSREKECSFHPFLQPPQLQAFVSLGMDDPMSAMSTKEIGDFS